MRLRAGSLAQRGSAWMPQDRGSSTGPESAACGQRGQILPNRIAIAQPGGLRQDAERKPRAVLRFVGGWRNGPWEASAALVADQPVASQGLLQG